MSDPLEILRDGAITVGDIDPDELRSHLQAVTDAVSISGSDLADTP